MDTGALISLYRRQAGMTIDELVELSGVPKGTLNKIIGGTTKAPTLDTMKAIAKALGKTLADFDDHTAPTKNASFLSNEALQIAKDYSILDAHGKHIVQVVLSAELDRISMFRQCLGQISLSALAAPAWNQIFLMAIYYMFAKLQNYISAKSASLQSEMYVM